jgi:hypothetical protein
MKKITKKKKITKAKKSSNCCATNAEELTNEDQLSIEKNGYIIHLVDELHLHTHGLQENFNHEEIEMIPLLGLHFPLNINQAKLQIRAIMHNIIDQIKQGKKFKADTRYNEIISNFDVKFQKTNIGLRLILPDPKGNLNEKDMDELFAQQFKIYYMPV